MEDFEGRKIFVTGASRGIGKSIKAGLEERGAVVISPARDEMDLLSEESVENYLEHEDLSDIDGFVHCAGINQLAGIDTIENQILERVFQVNLFSAIEIIKRLSKGMKERRYGRIVLISSLYALVSRENRIAYSTSKNALTGLSKTLTLELAPYNILTNCVAPGYVMTDMTRRNLSDEDIRSIEGRIPTGRFQEEKEIADLTAFLCSDVNKSITGQLIAVDGGFLCN